MRIKITKNTQSGFVTDKQELSFYVSSALTPERVQGITESATATIQNIKAGFGNLLDVLAEKKAISVEDVTNIVEDFETKIMYVE